MGVDVTLMWVPSHWDIPGNDYVDKLAKEATCRGQVDELFKCNIPLDHNEVIKMIFQKLELIKNKQDKLKR